MPEPVVITAHYEPGLEEVARLSFTVAVAHREALRRIEGLVREGLKGGAYTYAIRTDPDLAGMTHNTPFDTEPPP